MLENNNLKVCWKLVRRDFQFHKFKNVLIMASIAFICAMCTFSFTMGSLMQRGLVYNYETLYGSHSNILYYGLTSEQAERIARHSTVKSTVSLSPVGILSDDVMEYRSVRLAAVSPDWAERVEAMPVEGRMPVEEDEIALDEITLDSMGIPHEEGAEVTIRFKSMDGSREYSETFRLCGWWKSTMNYTETCAWITPETAQRLGGSSLNEIILGADLHQPKDVEAQGKRILQDMGLSNLTFTTNLSFNEALIEYAEGRTLPYFIVNIFVVLCGIFVIYNILHISVNQNIKFYIRLKSLGMVPRQILYLPLLQCIVLCVISIPAGWLIGFGMVVLIAPQTAVGMSDVNAAFFFFRVWPFAVSALITAASAMCSCWLSVKFAAGMSPAGLLNRTSARKSGKKRRRKSNEGCRNRVFQMAWDGVVSEKENIVLSVASLFVALTLLCGIWTIYTSLDEKKYMEGNAVADYLLADSSAGNAYQRYNPNSRSITSGMLELLREHAAVTELEVIKTAEVPMVVDERLRKPIVETFEREDETGTPRKEFMAGQPDWMAGYERLKETGEYIGIVTGIDGMILEKEMEDIEANDGTFSAEKFASGNYVVAAGSSSQGEVTTPLAGSRITICGREFTILASLPISTSYITGANSRAAEFNVSYYLPLRVYDELFPDSGIRNVLLNIDDSRQKEFEIFLTNLLEGINLNVASRSSHQKGFQSSRIDEVLVGLLVGGVLLIIGIINFINSLLTRMLVRKKEFAVYESLGMTKRKLGYLILGEGLMQGAILAVILLPCVSAAAWLWGRWWEEQTTIWCVTYRFALHPLWIAIPVLLLLSATVPFISLKMLVQESITDRLRILD